MSLKRSIVLLLFFAGALFVCTEVRAFEFKSSDRLLIVAPHPDDEAIGCAGAIQAALAAKAKVKVLYLTHGDQNEIASLFYQKKPMLTKKDFVKSGFIREKEALDAMMFLGLKRSDLVFMGYPDRGMLKLWRKYWGSKKPYRNFMTRLNRVAYATDFSFGSDYRADNVLRDFKKVFSSFKPNIILTTAPFDKHSDHQAAYLFTHLTVMELHKELPEDAAIFHYPVHLKSWPISKRYIPHAQMVEPEISYWDGKLYWQKHLLNDEELRLKAGAIAKYRSQMSYSKNFLLSFARQNELYGVLPYKKMGDSAASSCPVILGSEKGGLRILIDLKEPLDESGALAFDIFSYRSGSNFALMPKMSFKIYGKQLIVKDRLRKYKNGDIDYQFLSNQIEVHLPWKQLGNPEYLFVFLQDSKNETTAIRKHWQIYDVR